jgi:hypothetical protein
VRRPPKPAPVAIGSGSGCAAGCSARPTCAASPASAGKLVVDVQVLQRRERNSETRGGGDAEERRRPRRAERRPLASRRRGSGSSQRHPRHAVSRMEAGQGNRTAQSFGGRFAAKSEDPWQNLRRRGAAVVSPGARRCGLAEGSCSLRSPSRGSAPVFRRRAADATSPRGASPPRAPASHQANPASRGGRAARP